MPALPRPPGPRRVRRRQALVLLRPDRAPGEALRAALAELYRAGLRIRPLVEAILHAPPPLQGPADDQAAGRPDRGDAAGRGGRLDTTSGPGSPTSPASACSSLRTSPAGTRSPGSTPRPRGALDVAALQRPRPTRSPTRATPARDRPAGRRQGAQVLGPPGDLEGDHFRAAALRRAGRGEGDRGMAAEAPTGRCARTPCGS